MEEKEWRIKVDDKLSEQSTMLTNIYSELKDGDFRKGLFSQVKSHDTEINNLKTRVDDHQDTINEYRTIKKYSIKALWMGLIALLAKLAWWVIEFIRLGWKYAVAWIAAGNNHHG